MYGASLFTVQCLDFGILFWPCLLRDFCRGRRERGPYGVSNALLRGSGSRLATVDSKVLDKKRSVIIFDRL